MQVGFKTNKGKYRSNNEDACFVEVEDKFFVVADGVGGGNSGEIASRTTVNEIAKNLKTKKLASLDSKDEIVSYFQSKIEDINKKIYTTALSYEENTGMATTLVFFYIRDNKAYIANVGDSRAYIYRNGVLKQLTEDHTYVNTLVKAGILTKDQAMKDSRKNMITRAIGAEATVNPDFFMVDVKADDIFMICTDGLYDEVSDKEIKSILKNSIDMSSATTELVNKANENGGHDNITLVCVKVMEEDFNER